MGPIQARRGYEVTAVALRYDIELALRYDIELVLKQAKHCFVYVSLYSNFTHPNPNLQGLSSMLLAVYYYIN